MNPTWTRSTVAGLRLRHAVSGDAALVLRFIRALADYEKLSHQVIATERDIENTLSGSNAGVEVVIAELDDDPVGFALFFPNYSTFLGRSGIHLEDLFVEPRARGRGVGRCLLSYVAHLACRRGCGRLEWSVLDWNEPARGFYASLGAQAMPQWVPERLSGSALLGLASEFADPAPDPD